MNLSSVKQSNEDQGLTPSSDKLPSQISKETVNVPSTYKPEKESTINEPQIVNAESHGPIHDPLNPDIPPITLENSATTASRDKTQDASDLQDALVSAGVNLQEEELNIAADTLPPTDDSESVQLESRSRKSDIINMAPLQGFIQRVLHYYGLSAAEKDVEGLISLSLEERLSDIIKSMILFAKHRTIIIPQASVIIDDIRMALHKAVQNEIKREEEWANNKVNQKLQADLNEVTDSDKFSGSNTATTDGNNGETSRKKPKKDLLSAYTLSRAKNVPEDVQKHMTNQTAQMAVGFVGGRKYSWLSNTTGSPQGALRNKRKIETNTSFSTSPKKPKPEATTVTNTADEQAKLPPYQEKIGLVTIRDALAALEVDAQDGGNVFGRGARSLYKAYAKLQI